MKKALLVIDMQNDFIDGTLGSAAAEATVPVIRKKIESYIREGYPVVATRDIHPEGYLTDVEGQRVPRHCIRGEKGAEITSAFSDFAFTLDEALQRMQARIQKRVNTHLSYLPFG